MQDPRPNKGDRYDSQPRQMQISSYRSYLPWSQANSRRSTTRSIESEAILNMPALQNKPGVQRLLGMVNYLAKFIPRMSEITAPLRELLKKRVPWHWTEKHQAAFEKIKEVLSTHWVLKYDDVTKPVVIQTDTSSKGLGAILLQGQYPIAYASKTIMETQENMHRSRKNF